MTTPENTGENAATPQEHSRLRRAGEAVLVAGLAIAVAAVIDYSVKEMASPHPFDEITRGVDKATECVGPRYVDTDCVKQLVQLY